MRLLFLDLDTLRPDHLGCYGYHRDTSPNIDRIAREGVRFDNYHASDAPCLPSRAALVSGQFGIHNGAIGHGGTAAEMRIEGADRSFRNAFSNTSLWTTFKAGGMPVASVSPFAERHSVWWFQAGMRETFNTGKGGGESAEEITPHVLDWIDRNGSDDGWVLHVNYWDPHTNYRAPEEFGNPFADEPLPEWMTPELIEEHNTLPGGHSSREFNMWNSTSNPNLPRSVSEVRNMEQYRKMIDGYDCGIAYMDSHIGRLLDALEAKGVLEDTAVVVTSDHGECLGELNCYGEHGTADEITTRIPMIIRWPGGRQGAVDSGLHYNVDLAPTVAELLDVGIASRWDGQSYAPSITGDADCGREYLVVSQCCHSCQRSVRWGPWLYIRTIHDFFHMYPKEMLFNIEDDFHETKNLAEERPDICAEGSRLYLEWWEEQMMRMPDAIDPLWTVMREGGPFHSRGHLPAYCKRLKETGREQWVEPLEKRHPYEFEGA